MTIHKNPLVKPFVKWAGGKRQLLPEIKRYLPSKIKDYYEPFVGGGAVFLDIQCPHPVINDFNDELINTYLVVRDDVDSLIHLLKKHELNNSSDYYYQMRAWDRTGELQKRSNTERAARFIYLNKTGFNGLFRVNSQGQINVPYGRYKNPAIVNEEVLHAVSLYTRIGILIFGEWPTAQAKVIGFIALALVVIGIVLSSNSDDKGSGDANAKNIAFLLITTIGFWIYSSFPKLIAKDINPGVNGLDYIFPEMLGVLVGTVVYVIASHSTAVYRNKMIWRNSIAGVGWYLVLT